MGTVWSAYDEFLHRPVAVKEVLLPPGVPASQADELRERTLREARAIAVLSHPNVIILHDVARENGEPFVVMELLPSRSLAHLLRDHGPLSVEQAAAVGNAVAAALEAAHAAGITHRDVKPGNVLVAADGRIKLTDFGIARNVSEATMTRTGMMLGSPAYIAPEVASGGAVLARRCSPPSKAARRTTPTGIRWKPWARWCTATCRSRLPVRSPTSSPR
jgi:serine/threonine protein kinase